MSFFLRVDNALASLRAKDAELVAALGRGVGRTTAYAAQLARVTRTFKDVTGRARASIEHHARSSLAQFVRAGGTGARYLRFLERSKPHEIRPKLARKFVGPARPGQGRGRGAAKPVLRFMVNGQWVSKKMVKHPGINLHFMQDARDGAEAAAPRFFEEELNAVLRR